MSTLEPHEKRLIKKIVIWVVALIILGMLISWPLGIWRTAANPDRVVGSYERFFNRCASVQSLEAQRDALEDQLEGEEDDAEIRRLRSALTGVTSQRARTINTYNAEAQMVTRQWFRSERLPPRLDANDEHTTCTL